MTTDTSELKNRLSQHTGTQDVFRHSIVRSFVYTEGVKDFAENAGGGAYWLLDILATEPEIRSLIKGSGMAFATLKVNGGKGRLSVDDGNDSPPVYTRDLDYTDCPSGEWMFYMSETEVAGQQVTMILLPSEY